MSYDQECLAGRSSIAATIDLAKQEGNLPVLVAEIRRLALDDSGMGIGGLFEVAERLLKGSE